MLRFGLLEDLLLVVDLLDEALAFAAQTVQRGLLIVALLQILDALQVHDVEAQKQQVGVDVAKQILLGVRVGAKQEQYPFRDEKVVE